MLEPSKSAPNYEEERKRFEQELKDGNGVTSWGVTAQAVDILKGGKTTPSAKEAGK